MRYGFQKRFIKRAMNMGLLTSNPLAESSEAKLKPPERDKEPGLTDEELELTYAYLDKAIETAPESKQRGVYTKRQLLDFRGMMIVEEGTGARLNEVCSLRLSSIDREAKRLHFVAHKTGKKHNIRFLEQLWDHVNSMDPSDDPDPPLFISWYRPPGANVSTISNAFRKIFTAAGIRKPGRLPTSRCFRRRVATEVGKINPVAAQGLLGHSKVDTTTIYMVGNQKDVDEGSAILKTRAVAGRKKQPVEVRPDSSPPTDPDDTGISSPEEAGVVSQHATDTESSALGK